MVDLVYCLKNLLFFGISLLYYYINLRLSILFCLCFGGLHLTYFFVRLYIFWFISNCFRIILWWSCQDFCNFICKFVSSCFCCFSNCSPWSSFKCICCRLFNMVKKPLALFTAKIFTYVFANIFTHVFNKTQKLIALCKFLIFRFNWIARHLLYFTF